MPLFSAKCTSDTKLSGKTAIVTGCNTGIGKETVKDFYKRGARVIMACRNTAAAEEAKAHIEKAVVDKAGAGNLVVKKLDLGSLASVRKFADEIIKEEPRVNILVNNAGVMICPEGKTEDGFETQFGTNHLAHFLLTLLLLPKIIKSAPARIVNVSSKAHTGRIDFEDPNFERKPYAAWAAYCQSKLSNILFTKELSKKLKENNINDVTTYSLHPGAIATDLQRHVDTFFFRGIHYVLTPLSKLIFKTPWQGAQTNIYCSVDEKCANESGLYYAECAIAKPSDEAENEESAKKLWELSIKSVKYDGPDPFAKN